MEKDTEGGRDGARKGESVGKFVYNGPSQRHEGKEEGKHEKLVRIEPCEWKTRRRTRRRRRRRRRRDERGSMSTEEAD